MKSTRFEHVPGVSLPLVRLGVHACPYLPDRVASDLVVLAGGVDSAAYQALMDHGFRRSGPIFYRPDCPGCRACVPIRVPVERFHPSRSQRRVLRRNGDVHVEVGPAGSDAERFDLYNRYQESVHAGGMASTRDEFERFFCVSPITTVEMTYRIEGRLVGVGLVDVCPRALSSVYFYYDPAFTRRSLGVFSSLCELEECRRRGCPWWYVGFHVRGCRKMEYKQQFAPGEYLHADGVWRESYPGSITILSEARP